MKSDAIRQMFYEEHVKGTTYKEIAEKLGTSTRVLSNWAREMGLPARPRGGLRRPRWMPGWKTRK
ncbi:MAG TPA: hypothetical protein VJX47_04840 [Candidatus Sulfotelmatobacter sp.]|nr:hypothetical protein [Candidatus Sulfotelmatobacter sp.]